MGKKNNQKGNYTYSLNLMAAVINLMLCIIQLVKLWMPADYSLDPQRCNIIRLVSVSPLISRIEKKVLRSIRPSEF